jgi:hypothetical protein
MMKQTTEATPKTAKKPESVPVSINQPFFTMYQAWVIKGCVCAWNSFSRYRYIQPKGGFFDGRIGGRGVFTNETIMEWLPLMDADMDAYNDKHMTGAKPRNAPKRRRRRAATV